MADKHEVEIFIVMDENGYFGVGGTEEAARRDYNIGSGELGFHRLVRHVVKMTPAVQEESTAEVSDSAGENIEAESF